MPWSCTLWASIQPSPTRRTFTCDIQVMSSSPVARVVGPDQIRPLRRVEYDQLVALGAFAGERLELLAGALVAISPQHAPHAATIARLTKLLVRRVSEDYDLRFQLPLAIADDSEPEPDAAIVPAGDYQRAHPTTALLVIEVADSSLVRDRRKAERYGAAGVPECWIVDLAARAVEVYSGPTSGGYTARPGASPRPARCYVRSRCPGSSSRSPS